MGNIIKNAVVGVEKFILPPLTNDAVEIVKNIVQYCGEYDDMKCKNEFVKFKSCCETNSCCAYCEFLFRSNNACGGYCPFMKGEI